MRAGNLLVLTMAVLQCLTVLAYAYARQWNAAVYWLGALTINCAVYWRAIH